MLKMTAELWNAYYPVGTVVLFEPALGHGEYERRATRSAAWTLGHGEVVVSLEGRAGGCSVEHMAPVVIPTAPSAVLPDGCECSPSSCRHERCDGATMRCRGAILTWQRRRANEAARGTPQQTVEEPQ
jgi:hypothetical protein